MGLGDFVTNKIMGTNIKSIGVTPEQLADIIDKVFVVPAQSREELDELEKKISGNMVLPSEFDSKDGRFHLFVSGIERGLVTHRTVWVKNYETEEVFEWSGYTLEPIKRLVAGKITKKRIDGFETKIVKAYEPKRTYEKEIVSAPRKVRIIKCPYCAELIRSDETICPVCDMRLN